MTAVATEMKRAPRSLLEKEGKYLTFTLANEEYGLEILKVREIIGYMDITAVPQTPAHIKGVINLRGQVTRRSKACHQGVLDSFSLQPHQRQGLQGKLR